MRMVFSDADELVFRDACDRLVGRFDEWAGERGLEVDPFAVEVALEHKWAVGDGILSRWTVADLRELLLGWMPLKIAMMEEQWATVLPTLRVFFDFLTRTGLADPRCDPGLPAALEELAGEFNAAMGDESRYGVAKHWAMMMLRRGVDIGNEEQVGCFVTDVQAGEVFYDPEQALQAAILTGQEQMRPRRRRLAAVALPADEELAAAAAGSEVLRRLRVLLSWVGDGRRLTQTGRITLADARELVELLGTGDVVDPVVHDRVYRTKSSEELYGLNVTVEWAKAARLVRTAKGRLLPVKKNVATLDRPLELWGLAFAAFPRLGLAICSSGWTESMLRYQFDEGACAVLTAAYTLGGDVALADLHELVWDLASERYETDEAPQQQHRKTWQKLVEHDLRRMLQWLEILGALRMIAGEAGGTATGEAAGGTAGGEAADETTADRVAELTALGRWGTRRMLQDAGFEAPVMADIAGEEAEVVVHVAGAAASEEDADALLRAWSDARGEQQAIAELTALLRRSDDVQQWVVTLDALVEMGAAGIEVVMGLRDDDRFRPYPTLVLAQHGVVDQAELGDTDVAVMLAEQLATVLLAGDEQVVDVFTSMGDADVQRAALEDMGRCGHPKAPAVLTAIARHHQDPKVARTARKAALRAG
ncbi:hypothetical protein [Protofrankia symbiont of Coriaria ruscifolia]|uniref:hypothetical protein n=1 Tax=Protofrankia symbiont of Coriaria ruscifolia TaxID=1306542 RepID=UPI00104189EF|nr:hypothetical protein [Protofrankia symbiont of Coriaria ruscifolia]